MKKVDSHNNFFIFTAALVILLICSAFVSSTPAGEDYLILQAVIFLTQAVAYLSVNMNRRWQVFALILLALNVLTNSAREITEWSPVVVLLVYLAFFLTMMVLAARQALFRGRIEPNSIAGAFAVYLLIGLVWTVLYLLAMEYFPNSFRGLEHTDWQDNFGQVAYFSYVTMTTLGYGDISPNVPITKTLAYLQAVVGTFYMAVVVASLVGAMARKNNH